MIIRHAAQFAAASLGLALAGIWSPAPAEISKTFGAEPALARKMTSDLLAARQDTLKGKAPADAIRARQPHAIRGGQLQCIAGLTGPASEDLLAACRDAGLTVVGAYNHDDIGLYQLVIRCDDPAQLDAIALRDDVRQIASEPLAITAAGSVTAQSDASLDGPAARSTFNVDGSGVRVGVLSDSIKDSRGGTISGGLLNGAINQISGDLPANIRVIDPGFGSGSDEGAAMAELIFDIAPGCDIAFASAFTSYAAFSSNILLLRTDATHPSQVIVDDVIYFAEPMYQDGPIAIAARNCGLNGVPYFSAAGNFAAQAHEAAYFDPNVSDEAPLSGLPTGVDFHDFGAAKGLASDRHLQIVLPNSTGVTIALHWDEPYGGTLGGGPGAEADLDIYLVNSTALPLTAGMVLASSISPQGTVGAPLGDPIEVIQYFNTSGGPQNAHVVIDHYDGREPVNLHLLMVFSGSGAGIVDTSLAGDRTLFGHAAAENVMAVGAMLYAEIDSGGSLVTPNGLLNVEEFSALGGALPFWFSDNGTTRFGAAVTRQKPEITAPDGANTTFFGQDTGLDADIFPEFFGTSAAAPHAAAVAALMLERNPTFTVADLYQTLIATAIDAETPGADDLSGAGVINALAALAATPGLAAVRSDWRLYE